MKVKIWSAQPRKLASYLLVTVALMTVAAVPALAVTPTDWPGYMFGAAHSSDNTADTAITPANVGSLAQQWHFGGSYISSPVVADGYVFIGSAAGNFWELNATTGAVVQKVFLGTQPRIGCPALGFASTAAVALDPSDNQDTVYVADPRGYLLAMAIPSLTVKWRSVIAIPSKTSNNYFDWSSPTVANGTVYVGISSNCDHPLVRGGVRSFDQATGHVISTFYTVPQGQKGGSVWTSVAVDAQGYVYAATGNPDQRTTPYFGVSIVKLRPRTLGLAGHFTVPLAQRTQDNDFGGSPTIFGPYVGACNHNGIYYAINRSTMTEAWQRRIGAKIGGEVQSQCAAGAAFDGKYLYIAGPATSIHGKSYPGSIRRVSISGNFQWQTGLPDGVIGAPTMNGGGVLAVGTYDVTSTPNAFYLVNSSTGQRLRHLIPGSFDFAQPTLANGWLFTANGSGLYAWKP